MFFSNRRENRRRVDDGGQFDVTRRTRGAPTPSAASFVVRFQRLRDPVWPCGARNRISEMRSVRQSDAAGHGVSEPTGDRLSCESALAPLELVLPAAVIAGVGGAVFLWRTLTWQPAVRVDGWAYAAWGQALARGERPLFDLSATTPKPLAALIGFLVVPLPPERAFAVVAALALGALAASLFAVAYREGGAAAAAISVVTLLVGAQLNVVVAFGYIDAVVSALVLAGVALRGRLRIATLILAGLLRPEAWVLAAVAGFSETAGSLGRRASGALLAGLVAPVLWVLSDLALIRDPLGTLHWQSQRRRELGAGNVHWTDVPGDFWAALTEEASAVLVVAGLIGLVLRYGRAGRRGIADWFPLAVVVVWPLLVFLETHFSGGVNPRYLLPVIPLLALGCGLLAASIFPSRLRMQSPWRGAAVGAAALVVVAISMDLGPGVSRQMARNAAIEATRPAVESVLSCGRLGVTRRIPARDLIPQLAASSRRSLYEFGIYRRGKPFAAVLHATQRKRAADPALPPWPRFDTALGPLAVAPWCAPPA
jgi:hypothetical protein